MNHACHHPSCTTEIPPRLYACRAHWFMLPAGIKMAILHTYKPGQEITKTPSAEYLKATKLAKAWYLQKEEKAATPF